MEAQWSHLWLSEEEQESLVMEDIGSEDDKVKEKRSLVRKIHMDRKIKKKTIKGTMGKIWQISKPANFKKAVNNIFIITFASIANK